MKRRGNPVAVNWRSAGPAAVSKPQGTAAQPKQDTGSRLEQARQEGFASGIATARQEVEQEIAPGVQRVADMVAELAKMRESVRERATPDLVQLALAVASRVLHRPVSVDPDALAGLLKAEFSKRQSDETSRVCTHPGLEPMLRQCLDRNGLPAKLVLVSDTRMKAGEVTFAIGSMTVPSAESSLAEIERGLTDGIGR